MSPFLRDTLMLGLYCGLIFWLSAQSTLPTPEVFAQQDKLMHMAAYAVMGWLAWRCFSHRLSRPLQLALSSIFFASIYGISDEWHQSFVQGRDADILDWMADTAGATLAASWLRLRYAAQSARNR